jgi:sugar (pentulose or hexulose) kinase
MTQSDQPSGDSAATDVATPTNSFSLDQYYREKLDNFRRELPEATRQLKEAGIQVVHINYDGCGDSGQIEGVTYLDPEGKPLDPAGRVTITERSAHGPVL